MKRRTVAGAHSPAKNSRAESRRLVWSSFSPNCIFVPSLCASSIASRQAQHEVSDDVPLHLGGPRLDRVAARAEVAVRPRSVVDRSRIEAFELTVRTEQLLRDLLEPLVQLA